ncbi:hypothetical protein, partial [Ralstonia pseudosolanacearum]|uniref:hypothetical protein n=1 Tax=Ralstonia pseudosolanacearum TaxID=1310165 RepID=UPI001E384D5D
GKSRESTQSAGLFTALSVWTVARKRQLAAWRGGFMQQRLVGTNADGAITTIHTESGNSFWKMLNNGNIDKGRCCINRI